MTSHEQYKDRAMKNKKIKGTRPKIAFPDKKITSDAEFSDDTSPVEDEKGKNYRKESKNKKIYEEKRQHAQMTLFLMILRKV